MGSKQNNLNSFLVIGISSREIIIVRRNLHVEPMVLTSQLFESLALRLRDEQRSEDADQPAHKNSENHGNIHEQCEDFHDVVQPSISPTSVPQGTNQSLCDDGANLTRRGADTMSC